MSDFRGGHMITDVLWLVSGCPTNEDNITLLAAVLSKGDFTEDEAIEAGKKSRHPLDFKDWLFAAVPVRIGERKLEEHLRVAFRKLGVAPDDLTIVVRKFAIEFAKNFKK